MQTLIERGCGPDVHQATAGCEPHKSDIDAAPVIRFKHASSLQAASAILQQLSSTVNSVQQTVSTGFQDTGAWYAGAVANGGDFTQAGIDPGIPPGSTAPPEQGGVQQDVPAAPTSQPAQTSTPPQQLQAQQQKKKSKWRIPNLSNVPLPR